MPVPDTAKGEWTLHPYARDKIALPLEKLSETPWCIEMRFKQHVHGEEELALRDRQFSARPLKDRLRLSFVGDSFTVGEGVPLEDALPKQFEQMVKGNIEVANVAWSGNNIWHMETNVSKAFSVLASDGAVAVLIPNDVHYGNVHRIQEAGIHDLVMRHDHALREYQSQDPVLRYLGWSRIVQLGWSRWQAHRISRRTIEWYLSLYEPEQNPDGLAGMRRAMRTFAEAPRRGVKIVIYPLMIGFESGYPLQPIHDRIALMAKEAGLDVLDLAPVFAGQKTEDLWVHPIDHHPNGRAHRMAAEAIVRWLREEHPSFLAPPDDRPAVSGGLQRGAEDGFATSPGPGVPLLGTSATAEAPSH
jgi:hypothetical protein